MGARTKPARTARRTGGAGPGAQGQAGNGDRCGAGSRTDRDRSGPLTREAVLRALAWTEPHAVGDEPAGGTKAGDDASAEPVLCPPVTASLIAEEILESLDPRRFLDTLVELAGDLQPVSSLEWLDLQVLVRNLLDGHDVALGRSRFLMQARVAQRAELLKQQARTKGRDLDGKLAESVARRSLQGDAEAVRIVAEVARQQDLTLADCDARALQRQLDLLIKLDALGEGALRRRDRVHGRIERTITAKRLAASDVAREAANARSAERAEQRKDERLFFKRERHEELRCQWQRQQQAHEEDRAFTREKRQWLRRRWGIDEDTMPAEGPASVPDTTAVEVLGAPTASGGRAGGGDGG